MLVFRQIPAPLLGDVFRESLTSQYLKAEARVLYGNCLMEGDRQGEPARLRRYSRPRQRICSVR